MVAQIDDRVDELIELARDYSLKDDDEVFKIKALYGYNIDYLSTMLIHKGLFAENTNFITEILRDSLRIYSHIPCRADCNDQMDGIFLMPGLISECLIKLVKSQPMKSYLKLSFRQVLSFILYRSAKKQLIDVPYLLSFLNELRSSFDTLCSEDRQTLKPNSRLICSVNFIHDAKEDASFLVSWSMIEAAKYCINHKFAPEISANEFLSLLQKETLSPVVFGDGASKRCLINFQHNLEKFLSDRILPSSTGKHTFASSGNIEQFYQANSSNFSSWLTKNRSNVAQLSFILDEPAECWRNSSLKLCSDLVTKSQGLGSSGDELATFNRTLKTLKTTNLYLSLSLITLSARQLDDLPLLQGIRAIESRGIIAKYPPLAAIISNHEGRYQATYDYVKTLEDADEQSLIEFLDSCIEMNVLNENVGYIDRISSKKIRDLYRNYAKSKETISEVPKSRFKEVEQWLSTWSFGSSDFIQPIRSVIDLVVPTCLNIISKVPEIDRSDMITKVEHLVCEDHLAKSLFPPNYINRNIKIYHLLIQLLRGNTGVLNESFVESHASDLHMNHLLYRHLRDLNMIEPQRKQDNKLIDLIQLKAVKFNRKSGNFNQMFEIAQDLTQHSESDNIKILSSFQVLRDDQAEDKKCNELIKIKEQIKSCTHLETQVKSDLLSKVLRNFLRLKLDHEVREKNEALLFQFHCDKKLEDSSGSDGSTTLDRWKKVLDSSSLNSRAKTLSILSRQVNERLQSSTSINSAKRTEINYAFKLDLRLLESLCQSDLTKHKSEALECSTRLLNWMSTSYDLIDTANLDYFKSGDFMNTTISVWTLIKSNLILLVSYQDNLSAECQSLLIKILKMVGQSNPNLLIYNIIVNRLDLQSELVYLSDENSSYIQDPCIILLDPKASSHNEPSSDHQESSNIKECQRKLTFWNELLDHIKSNNDSEINWRDVVSETERFLKEIRRISFLCGEYFRTLTIRIPKRLYCFLDYMSKLCDTTTGTVLSVSRREECEKRLKSTCDQAINQIKVLLIYSSRVGKAHLSKYDIWFFDTYNKQLRELEYRLNLLMRKKPLVLGEIEKLIKSITELLAVCRASLLEYNHNNRYKLFMELINPMLSRLEPSCIPMPDCCDLSQASSRKAVVTIHKISQTVNLIVSKTSPKKLKFIGSDGLSRSFLLKAHEDLRLDQLIMDLFGSINQLLLGDKATGNKCRLRRYSVTPVSSRSGLIQWIEAPSMCSSYRTWLNGPKGKKVVEEIYANTCSALCTDEDPLKPSTSHVHCQPPQGGIQTADIFYQILWAETKALVEHPIAKTRPSFGNIVKYRAEFEPELFQNIVQQLIYLVPSELVANQLWYKSNNSHSYWLKTREFTRSCATISVVGYIIGLGDRHPENVLLDHNNGEVIHIDYTICFELGKTLSIPERVPFRLTQNMIYAFGFAGLEGGFTQTCREVLRVLKASKSTLLHLLNPINFKFMIGQPNSLERAEQIRPPNYRSDNPSCMTKNEFATGKRGGGLGLDMRSQESVEMKDGDLDLGATCFNGTDTVDELLMLNHRQASLPAAKCAPIRESGDRIEEIKPIEFQVCSPAFDLQHNIKTPTKILAKTAQSIHERIRDKLSGADESIRKQDLISLTQRLLIEAPVDSSAAANRGGQPAKSVDLITLDCTQSVEDQVDALILEATSIKNKAAMFEGWIPWV